MTLGGIELSGSGVRVSLREEYPDIGVEGDRSAWEVVLVRLG
jgi:hypothetical protein